MRLFIIITIQLLVLRNVYSQSGTHYLNYGPDTCKFIKDLFLSYKDDTVSQNKIYHLGFKEYEQFMALYDLCLEEDTSILMTLDKLGSDSLFRKLYKPKLIDDHYFVSDTLDFDKVEAKAVKFLTFTFFLETLIGDRYFDNHFLKEYISLMGIIIDMKFDYLEREFFMSKPTVNSRLSFSIANIEESISELNKLIASKTTLISTSINYTFDNLIEIGVSTNSDEEIDLTFDYLWTYVRRVTTEEESLEHKKYIGLIIARHLDNFNNDNIHLRVRIKEFLPFYNPERGTVIDFEGNSYITVKIGQMWWMAENLKSTYFKDGTAIPNAESRINWQNSNKPVYCWYMNDEKESKNIFGALYNWYAVNTNKLCPSGWHVPTKSEWDTLVSILGGHADAESRLQEIGKSHWKKPNQYATNETGFRALPGGRRTPYGLADFNEMGDCGTWWSSSEETKRNAYYYRIPSYFGILSSPHKKEHGHSVRCTKD